MWAIQQSPFYLCSNGPTLSAARFRLRDISTAITTLTVMLLYRPQASTPGILLFSTFRTRAQQPYCKSSAAIPSSPPPNPLLPPRSSLLSVVSCISGAHGSSAAGVGAGLLSAPLGAQGAQGAQGSHNANGSQEAEYRRLVDGALNCTATVAADESCAGEGGNMWQERRQQSVSDVITVAPALTRVVTVVCTTLYIT